MIPLVVPANAKAPVRRSIMLAVVLGVAAAIALTLLGHPLLGLFGFVGLALGAANSLLVERAIQRFTTTGEESAGRLRFRLALGGLVRLGVITVLAVGCAVAVRPEGLGVFAGLAVFQLIVVVNASVPLIKELRQS